MCAAKQMMLVYMRGERRVCLHELESFLPNPHSKLVDSSRANTGKQINKRPPSSTCAHAQLRQETEKFINYVRSHTTQEIVFPS